MTRPLDFFFFYGSLYSYIAVMRIDKAARAAVAALAQALGVTPVSVG